MYKRQYLYVEAFGRAIRRTGQIILDLIPHVYDTERTIQIVGEDGHVAAARINQAAISPADGITEQVLNDVTVGSYHLVMEMGPSYSTKREEARDGMTTLMQTLGPNAVSLVADIFAKQQDWPLADKIAKRFRLLLPPPVQAAEAQENGEPPPPPGPPPPSPELQLELAKAQHEQKLDAARLELDSRKLQVEMAKINAELEKARIEHPGVPGGDPRIDELAQAIAQLRDMILHVATAVAGPMPGPHQ